MEKSISKKYALKHFLFVGILGGFFIAEIFIVIINQPLGMFLYKNSSMPTGNATNDMLLTISSILIIIFSIYIGNILFAKAFKANSIPKEQLSKSAMFFSILIFIFFTNQNSVLSMLNTYAGCLSSACKTANPEISTIPMYFLMYLLRIIIIPLGFLFISRKYFTKNEVLEKSNNNL